jgi:hypothetical protein
LALHQWRLALFGRGSIVPRAIFDIAADGKRPLAVSFEDHDLHVVILLGATAKFDDRLHHVAVHRVQ